MGFMKFLGEKWGYWVIFRFLLGCIIFVDKVFLLVLVWFVWGLLVFMILLELLFEFMVKWVLVFLGVMGFICMVGVVWFFDDIMLDFFDCVGEVGWFVVLYLFWMNLVGLMLLLEIFLRWFICKIEWNGRLGFGNVWWI